MAKSKAQKRSAAEILSKMINDSNATVVAEYRGMTVGELTELRRRLRAAGGEFHVAKNRVVIKGIQNGASHAEPMVKALKGPVGVAYLKGDVAAGAKQLLDYSKENDKFKVKGGLFEGKALSMKDLDALASLPPREVLMARIIGTLVAPHRGLLGILTGVPRNVVSVINAIKDKKN